MGEGRWARTPTLTSAHPANAKRFPRPGAAACFTPPAPDSPALASAAWPSWRWRAAGGGHADRDLCVSFSEKDKEPAGKNEDIRSRRPVQERRAKAWRTHFTSQQLQGDWRPLSGEHYPDMSTCEEILSVDQPSRHSLGRTTQARALLGCRPCRSGGRGEKAEPSWRAQAGAFKGRRPHDGPSCGVTALFRDQPQAWSRRRQRRAHRPTTALPNGAACIPLHRGFVFPVLHSPEELIKSLPGQELRTGSDTFPI